MMVRGLFNGFTLAIREKSKTSFVYGERQTPERSDRV